MDRRESGVSSTESQKKYRIYLAGGAGSAAVADAEALQAFLEQKTREHVLRVLDRTGWRKRQAAEILDIDRATLYRMLKRLQLERD